MENRVFVSEIPQEDLNRIDVLNEEENNSNHSVRSASSLGSRNRLTAEFIELSTNNSFLRRKSSVLNITNYSDGRRIPTPTNMVRRWSQSISRFSKDKRSLREKTIYRLPSRMVFEADGKLISDDPDAELEQLVQEIEQHAYLMQDTALSKQSRLETLRALPQHLSTKRLLKAQLSIDIEKQHAKDQSTTLKTVLNFVIAVLLKAWLILRKIYGSFEMWYSALKTIEGHFGSNVTSYFKFLRCLLIFNMFLLICPLCFITLPQILYNDDLSRRRLYDNQATNETTTSWDFMDLLTGEGFLKSSLLFYGSYSNESFGYRNSHTTYSIPHAYYMTMLLIYLSTFIIISLSVARSYRRSFIEASGEARVLYAQKVFCAWDYSISHRKAAELKHLAICSDLKEILNQTGSTKPKLSILWRIWIFFSHLMTHFLVFIVISAIGVVIWTYLKQFSSTTDDSYWNKLTLATIVNTSILVFQALFSRISRLEDYRTPQRTLHITLVRNFILEFVIMALLVYFWLTRKNVEGWETAIGQEIYRLIISDFFISVLVLPVFKCFQIFVMLRFWPKCERAEFDISQESLGLVYNQTLLLMGLFFAPLLGAIIIVKMIIQFYVNKAVLMYVCKSPQHVWRSAQTNTLYLLFTFLSLLGVIIALGYIMMQ